MHRTILTVAFFVGFLALPSRLTAAETEGELKAVDAEKGVITVTIGKKDRDFTVTKDTELEVSDVNQLIKPKDGLKDKIIENCKGRRVVVKTTEKDEKEIVIKITFFTGRKG
jgi:hypothetical protein